MSDLHVIATMRADPARAEKLRSLLLPATEAFRKEPGCLSYALLEDQKRPGRFVTHECWRDKPALDEHMQSPAMKEYGPQIKALLVEKMSQDFFDALKVL
jgi:quinol monooxygenase YgiN